MSLVDDLYIVTQEIKSVMKVFPDFIELQQFKEPFYMQRFDLAERRPYNPEKIKRPTLSIDELERMALARAKTKVIDLARCNPFDLFVTFTFAKDRQNVDAKKRQMAFWLNNQRILHGNFGYLIVPEYHKDGKALHFHGLLMDYKGKLVDSGKQQNGRTVYNIRSYREGFTTAVKIDNIEKVAGYISKYLTKDMPKFKGKQRYWRSNGLKEPLKILNPNLTDEDLQLFSQVYSNDKKAISQLRGRLSDNELARMADFGKRRYDDLYVSELTSGLNGI